ncbi:hypothetical protein MNEG_4188 [Monoraphidium neglectum]|uniref:Carbohydrate binding module family 25 domain-containing protein n=1 Tax=Monoraphidium neglectum TaxID=145388 RepID=A0A0D2JZ35_9CHLO|nr:hypothetical protein MNEG_4188 [Monoraphidium neglectum]KIZ03773.1 hypothetical protein MNEG_4188 [Monoraphidium neglectum]|eukprot:XP_013902792.1 hypothetical protein MNEG_4188 [Monoraphidium neglectum]
MLGVPIRARSLVDQARAKAVDDVELFSAQLLAERKDRARLQQRVVALESDLVAAAARVAELESQVAASQKHLQQLQQQQPQQQQAAEAAAAPQQQEQQQAQQAAPPAPPAAPPAEQVATITLNYYTGWHDAFIHFNADRKGWTQTPGVKLARGPDGGNHRTALIEASVIEFVMNNGHNEWDSPGRYTDTPANYQIQAPGVYKLRSGRLEKLSG